jgi:hypothetical protein
MMRTTSAVSVLTALLAVLALRPPSAAAAGTCTGTISKLPVVIAKSGVWCLKKNLATAANGITGIDIQADNVTVECNGFTLDGLAAGPATNSTAIAAAGTRSNLTIRNCTIRGFRAGIFINDNEPGSGHLVEDNRLDQITSLGIYVLGHGSVVRRNRVVDTGGAPGSDRASAFVVLGDAIDNVVDGMAGAADVADFSPEGIYSGGVGGIGGVGFLVQGNRVRNLQPKGVGIARGITTAGIQVAVRGNSVVQPAMTNGQGIFCSISGILRDNDVINYSSGIPSCFNASENVVF